MYNDEIIEICCMITDGNLKLLTEECFESVVHCPKERLDKMNDWCIEHHGQVYSHSIADNETVVLIFL